MESKGLKLNSNDWMNGTVIIDSTVGSHILFSSHGANNFLYLSLDPNGMSMENFTVDSNFQNGLSQYSRSYKGKQLIFRPLFANFTGENTSFDIINVDANTCIISKTR